MRNIVLLIVLSLAFCWTEASLTYFLPLARTDFDVWLKYFMAKDAVYDAMFFLFSLVLFWNLNERVSKSVSVFLVIVTGGSFIDKVLFDINQYLLSDIVLISMGILLSINTYRKWKTSKAG
jgi:hypothetical protein